jgi:ankyrin repeat protein
MTDIARFHEAVRAGDIDYLKRIISDLQEPAIPAFLDRQFNGTSPLDIAASLGYLDIAQYLIDQNASRDTANARGRSPLHSAALGGFTDIARLLIDSGAILDHKDVPFFLPKSFFTSSRRQRSLPCIPIWQIRHSPTVCRKRG